MDYPTYAIHYVVVVITTSTLVVQGGYVVVPTGVTRSLFRSPKWYTTQPSTNLPLLSSFGVVWSGIVCVVDMISSFSTSTTSW